MKKVNKIRILIAVTSSIATYFVFTSARESAFAERVILLMFYENIKLTKDVTTTKAKAIHNTKIKSNKESKNNGILCGI